MQTFIFIPFKCHLVGFWLIILAVQKHFGSWLSHPKYYLPFQLCFSRNVRQAPSLSSSPYPPCPGLCPVLSLGGYTSQSKWFSSYYLRVSSSHLSPCPPQNKGQQKSGSHHASSTLRHLRVTGTLYSFDEGWIGSIQWGSGKRGKRDPGERGDERKRAGAEVTEGEQG